MTDPIRAEAIARSHYPDGSVLATLFLADALHRIADVHEWDTSDQWWTIHGQPNPAKGQPDTAYTAYTGYANAMDDVIHTIEFVLGKEKS